MAKKKHKNQERKNKINLVFDESKRKDFLCGFRKRKLERKKKAQEELQKLLKEEKRRIKQENKESYKKLVVSSRPIPDIEQLLKEEYEDDDVNVKILELSSDTLQKKDLVIGENRPKEKEDKTESKSKKLGHTKSIPGMEIDEESAQEQEETETDLKSKKDIKRMLKKQATKKVQKSKIFQMKSKLERVKNKKKSAQKNRYNMKNIESKKNKSNKKTGKRKH